MQGWIMLDAPGLLLLYGLGMGTGVLDRRWQTRSGWLTWLAGALIITAAALLILRGASLWEVSAWLTAFLLLIMGVKE